MNQARFRFVGCVIDSVHEILNIADEQSITIVVDEVSEDTVKNSTNYLKFREIEQFSKSKKVEIVTSSGFERNKEKEILQLQQQ